MMPTTPASSIVEAASAAARSYPNLKIVCPRCRVSVLGSAYEVHAASHAPAASVAYPLAADTFGRGNRRGEGGARLRPPDDG